MFEIYFYNAECGDAARIRFKGSDNKMHNIFIDSGYERTFRFALADVINSIQALGERIDLWIVTHIHDDHIGGIVAYIKAIKSGEFKDIVDDWCFNPPRIPILQGLQSVISESTSIGQGDILTNYLITINKLPDIDSISTIPKFDFFGIKITILSPDIISLKSLRNKYSEDKFIPLERIEGDTISDTMGARQNDYHNKLEKLDLDVWKEDKSIENASSIALVTEIEGKNIMWLSDALPTIICSKLQELGYSIDNPITCEFVKVSHHGSDENNNEILYSFIRCNNYIIPANGENKYHLPSKTCIARILRNKVRHFDEQYNIYFTDDNQTLKSIFISDFSDVIRKLNFNPQYLDKSKKAWKFDYY
jgi:hypothetical protein